MAEDREILREVWEGKVPVSFTLSPEEVSTYEHPESCYLLVPRHSYFPLFLDKLQKHFINYVNGDENDIWLENTNTNQPIKWHYPVGVLFDLLNLSHNLPWNLTVHFKNFPDSVFRWNSKEAIESHFMSCVKEADALKHVGKVINGMQIQHHKQLWAGLLSDKFEQFWAVNKKLMEGDGDETFKSIPFRIYQGDSRHIQKLFKPQNDRGDSKTLRDMVQEVAPQTFNEDGSLNHKIVLHGVEVPLESDILWLSEHLSYPDNFLHICLIPL